MRLVIVRGLLAMPPSLRRLNAEFRASRESTEPRAETHRLASLMPRGVAKWHHSPTTQRKTLASIDRSPRRFAAGLAAVASELTVADGLTGYLFGFAENQVMVLAKALPMGQIAAQVALRSGDAGWRGRVLQCS